MDNLIEIINVSKSFLSKNGLKTDVLIDLNMEIKSNEFVALMGPSGAGKSTLLYLLGLLDKQDKGEIAYFLDNQKINLINYNDNKISNFRNKEIGFIFQFYHLLPELNALENIMIPAIINGVNKLNAKEEAMKLIEKVGLENKINNKPNELSGGEQQRIAIARALINKPRILLADEPTGNLDSINAELIVGLLHEIKSEYQVAMIMATHSLEIAKTTDKIFHLKDGKIFNIETN